MRDADCVAFLQWALPRLRLKWSGFRKVRRQVCRRVQQRMRELGLDDFPAYQTLLETHAEEWDTLDRMCRITISRFYRDKGVFEVLASTVLPALACGALSSETPKIAAWSAGCGSGEEPYTVALLWEQLLKRDYPDCDIVILGTDCDRSLLRRAAEARYQFSSLRDIPVEWRNAFEPQADGRWLAPQHRTSVRFMAHDLRTATPRGPFDMVLCRNLAFTYWEDELQLDITHRIKRVLRPCGYLVIGAHEKLPLGAAEFTPCADGSCVFQKR